MAGQRPSDGSCYRGRAALLGTHPLEGVETTTRDGSVWETNVVPHELHRLFGEQSFLWGGDLNCDPKMDDRPGFAGGNRRVFEIYREAGAVDARSRFHSTYQQTFFRAGTDSSCPDDITRVLMGTRQGGAFSRLTRA